MAGQGIGTISVDLEARLAKFESDFGRAARLVEQQMARIERTIDRQMAAVNARLASYGRSIANQFNTLLGGLSVAFIIRGLQEMVDGYANVIARLRLVTSSTDALKSASQAVYDISRRTYTSMESTSLLVLRTTKALEGQGRSQQEALGISLRLSETINKAFAVSGATAAEAKGAVIQLSQALGAGALRGDEFRSVNEQGQRIIQALAASLHVTTGELKKMADAGELTTKVVVKALLEQGGQIDKEFAKLPVTIGRAFQVLQVEIERYIGEANQASGVSQALANVIIFLGQHLDAIALILATLAGGWLVRLGATVLPTLVTGFGMLATRIALTAAPMSAFIAGGAEGVGVLGLLTAGIGGAAVAAGAVVIALGAITAAIVANIVETQAYNKTVHDSAVASERLAKIQAELKQGGPPSFSAKELNEAITEQRDKIYQVNRALFEQEEKLQKLKDMGYNAFNNADLRETEQRVENLTNLWNKGIGLLASLTQQQKEFNAAQAERDVAAANLKLREDDSAAFLKSIEKETKSLKEQIATREGNKSAIMETRLQMHLLEAAGTSYEALIRGEGKAWIDAQKKLEALNAERKNEAALRKQDAADKALDAAKKSALDFMDSISAPANAVAAAQAVADKGMRELEQRMTDWAAKGGNIVQITKMWWAGEKQLGENIKKTNIDIRNRNALMAGSKDIIAKIRSQEDAIKGLSSSQRAYNADLVEARKLYDDALKQGVKREEADKKLMERLKLIAELRDKANLAEILEQIPDDPFKKLVKDIETVEEALQSAFKNAPELVGRLEEKLGQLRHSLVVSVVDSTQQGLRSLQSMTTEGSKAFKAMQIAIDALTVVQAISAVLNQAQGDPYTAFARMAAMAAAVVALGVDIAGFGGGGGGPSAASAEVRQAHQGTGSVLGDAEAKSESIKNATEITANATQQLVGLNRGMLTALQALQSALGSAGTQLARGAGDAGFSPVTSTNYGLSGDPFSSLNNSIGQALFGGRRSVIDQGIVIAGGTLNDMLNQIVVGAYQTVHRSGGLFGHDSTHDNIVDVSAQFNQQFQLVISSIVDTVRQGALALGLLPADIEAAIAQFHVAEIRISLQGLSAEDQQRELEAVFSQIFDNLAGAVVPFISEFQKVGEGLGETLVRVATEVQVAQQAFLQLGLAVNETDPKKFAEIADGLIEAAGGIDKFIEGMNSFTEAFAPASHKFDVMFQALTSALDQVGLSLPATRDGMWDLMQSLDATTEEGQKQIATLLRLAGVSDQYYSALEKQQEDLLKKTEDFNSAFGPKADTVAKLGSELSDSLAEVGLTLPTTRDGMWQLMQSLDGSTEAGKKQIETLLNLIDVSSDYYDALDDQANALSDYNSMISDLRGELLSLTGGTSDYAQKLADIRSEEFKRINDLNKLARAAGLEGAATRDLAIVHQIAAAKAAAALKQLRQATVDLIKKLYPGTNTGVGQVSAGEAALHSLDDAAKNMFQEWQNAIESIRKFLDDILLDKNLTVLTPKQQLDEAQSQFYAALAAAQGGDANAAAELPDLARKVLENARGYYASGSQYTAIFDAVMAALQAVQMPAGLGPDTTGGGGGGAVGDVEAAADDVAQQRLLMAQELAQYLRDLADSLGESVFNLADEMGVNMTQFVQDLGVNLTDLSSTTAGQLADIANMLGVNLSDLTDELGISLGSLADANSSLNDAFEEELNKQPVEIKTQLEPLLRAVEAATNEADANKAIADLEAAVNEVGGSTATALAPYLSGVDAPSLDDQIDILDSLDDETATQTGLLTDIREWLSSIATALGAVPPHAAGAAYIERDHLAMVHEGEKIIDARSAELLDSYGIQVRAPKASASASADATLRRLLREVRDELRASNRKADEAPAKLADAISRNALAGRNGR